MDMMEGSDCKYHEEDGSEDTEGKCQDMKKWKETSHKEKTHKRDL